MTRVPLTDLPLSKVQLATMPSMRAWLAQSEATDALGHALATTRPPRAVVYLHGELGAGKSTLARALLRELGVTGAIRSPTYTLVERYRLTDAGQPAVEALHLDLYRIADAGELEFLGLDDSEPGDGGAALWLVEWPERAHGQALPTPDLQIQLDIHEAGRMATLQAASTVGRDWLARLSGSRQLQDSLQPFPES